MESDQASHFGMLAVGSLERVTHVPDLSQHVKKRSLGPLHDNFRFNIQRHVVRDDISQVHDTGCMPALRLKKIVRTNESDSADHALHR